MATIGQVAARAGVSRATVSRVCNGSATVSEATRLRVQRAIADLNYRPSARAQDLALGRNPSVAIIARSPAWELSVPIAQHLSEDGFEVAFVTEDAAEPIAGRVGGAVAQGTLSAGLLSELTGNDLPLVTTHPGAVGANRVYVDRTEAMKRAARHLAASGHRSVGLFDDGQFTNSEVADLRLIFSAAGLRLVRPLHQVESLATALAARGAPTAVLATSPLIALRTYNEARALGYLIPHELSIVALGEGAETKAMRISAIATPVSIVAQCTADLLQHLMASDRPVAPGVEIRVAAHYVPGVTTRRVA